MSLRPAELAAVSAALGPALAGAVVQKVGSPAALRVELELRSPGRSTRLSIVGEPELARLSVIDARTPAAGPASPWLLRLRKELVGTRLVEISSSGHAAELRFERQGVERVLVLELETPGALLLLGDGRRPLAASSGRARAPGADRPPPLRALPSRLPAISDGLELGRAVEALFSGQEAKGRAAALRRRRVQPLRSRVDRLRRTVEKVRGEANRTASAEEHRRFGELLRQNVASVRRGASEVVLTEYTAQGAAAVVVPLDPSLDARAQAERHFQRYRRLARGSIRAGARLLELERELSEAEAELEAAREASDASLLATTTAGPPPPPARTRSLVHQPYRVFHARSGERILVGRAGRDNDALTFGIARPDDLWLHARGIPGAHVLVPLPRGAQVSQETLLDAAHLALHHARGGGADGGEVSYTRAKFVRRAKAGAPGAVTYSREKTFRVRLQPERLERLLATREER